MSKINKQNIIKFICFAILFIFIFLVLQVILQSKWIDVENDSTSTTAMFAEYEKLEKDTVDVLFLGTSHVVYGIDSMYLYGETGYSSFSLGGPGERMDLTYLTLDYALRTQKPKIVFLDMSAIHYQSQQEEGRMHKVLDQLPLSIAKIKFAFDTNNDELDPLSCLFPMFRFHSRWADLKRSDFRAVTKTLDETYLRGHFVTYQQTPTQLEFESDKYEDFQVKDRTLDYLDRIIKLCKDNDIELICYKIPTPHWYSSHSTMTTKILEEKGLDFLELYYDVDEMGLNLETDFFDDSDHLNQYGSEKLMAFLGKYLSENYDLTDHRGEYKDWDEDYDKYLDYKEMILQKKMTEPTVTETDSQSEESSDSTDSD